MKYDPSKGICSDMCEFETQIFVPNTNDTTQSGKCEFCNQTCAKCAGSVDTCTLCKPGYVLNLDLSCQAACKNQDGTVALDQTAIDGVCMKCEKPCASCAGTINTCTSCLDNWLIFQVSKCVQYCPEKWIPNSEANKCIWEGLSCPDNFEIN